LHFSFEALTEKKAKIVDSKKAKRHSLFVSFFKNDVMSNHGVNHIKEIESDKEIEVGNIEYWNIENCKFDTKLTSKI